MDKLRRRLGETLGGTTKVEAGAPGELRLVATRPAAALAAADAPRRLARAEPLRGDAAAPAPRRAAREAGTAGGAHATHAGPLGLRRRRRPRRVGAPEFREHGLHQRQAPEPDRHPRRHQGRTRRRALRLPAERVPRRRQRPHGAGQRGGRQYDHGAGPRLRAAAVPLSPSVGGTRQRPPVRHGRAPGAQGRARPRRRRRRAARPRRGAADRAGGVEQPAAGEERWRLPRRR